MANERGRKHTKKEKLKLNDERRRNFPHRQSSFASFSQARSKRSAGVDESRRGIRKFQVGGKFLKFLLPSPSFDAAFFRL